MRIAIARRKQRDAVPAKRECMDDVKVTRGDGAAHVYPGRLAAADQLPFRLVVARVHQHAGMLAQLVGPRGEDMVAHIVGRRDEVLARLWELCGVEPFSPEEIYVKVTDDDLTAAVPNFEELRRLYEGTRYYDMFTDDTTDWRALAAL